MSDIISYLFETSAIRFCEEKKPFWLTSGKISPYFINAQFVYGNEKDASDLLLFIDEYLNDRLVLPKKIFEKNLKQYETNSIYKDVIGLMINAIKENVDISEIDYISGGERRDWFFSNIIAYLLGKPHISIFKDLTTFVSDSKFESTEVAPDITGKKVLHLTDLITIASSYLRAWIPAIENIGGKILWSCSVVDRMQGGKDAIGAKGVNSFSLANVDVSLFEKAFSMDIISEAQLDMLKGFFKDPDGTMKEFLINNPEFIENALNADEKTKKRAKLLIDGNLYGLN